jgi:sec-independent protein translocase protein TatC
MSEPPSQPPAVDDDGPSMTLVEHLGELRRRLIIVVVTVLVGAIAAFAISETVLNLLVQPLPPEYRTLHVTTPAGAFGAQLKIAGFLGLAFAMPVLLFHAYRFVAPGLTRGERRIVRPALVAAALLFAGGIALGYAVLPYMLRFLVGFIKPPFTDTFLVDDYIGFVTTTLLGFGLVLEFPVILVILARIGILSHAFLARRRRWVVLIIALTAIILTPGQDPISPLVIGIVMYLLFEVTLVLIKRIRG